MSADLNDPEESLSERERERERESAYKMNICAWQMSNLKFNFNPRV